MSKKDFELIAETIREWYLEDKPGMMVVTELSIRFIKRLQKENPEFDMKKFVVAIFPEFEGMLK